MKKDLILELYKLQSKIIYKYLLKHGLSKEDCEDIIHDSFIKAIEYIDEVEETKAASWLFTVTLNTMRTKKKRDNKILPLLNSEEFLNNLYADEDSLKSILLKDTVLEVRETLNLLSEGNKELLIMKYEMNFSYKDIGMILGFNENKVKTYLFRARENFKKLWREKYGQ